MQAEKLTSKLEQKAALADAAAKLVKAAVINQGPSSKVSTDTKGQLESVNRPINPNRLPSVDSKGALLPGFLTQNRLDQVPPLACLLQSILLCAHLTDLGSGDTQFFGKPSTEDNQKNTEPQVSEETDQDCDSAGEEDDNQQDSDEGDFQSPDKTPQPAPGRGKRKSQDDKENKKPGNTRKRSTGPAKSKGGDRHTARGGSGAGRKRHKGA